MGKHMFCEQNNSQVTKRGRYLVKYRPNLLGTQLPFRQIQGMWCSITGSKIGVKIQGPPGPLEKKF